MKTVAPDAVQAVEKMRPSIENSVAGVSAKVHAMVANSVLFNSADVDSLVLESVVANTVILDSLDVDSIDVDSMDVDSMDVDSVHAPQQVPEIIERTFDLKTPADTIYVSFFLRDDEIQVVHENKPLPSDEWKFSAPAGRIYFRVSAARFSQSRLVTIRYHKPILQIPAFYQYVLPPAHVDMQGDVASPSTRTIQNENETYSVGDDVHDGGRKSGGGTGGSNSPNLDGSNLIQSGSLSRGFTIGNRQDLSLESGLRLNLSGEIAEGVSVTAVLTDRSTPIQPDGTTQTLREFDRIFIEMRSEESRLQMGDVDLEIADVEFAAIRRRVQGASGEFRRENREVRSAFSLVRGTFHSIDFRGTEGVQGPYRLQGISGERPVLVIAGSERVFLDGELLTRGRDHDYMIDYSLGEITFTHRRLITENHRISVDFEYRTGDYSRSLIAAQGREDRMMDGKLSVGAAYVREADGKNLLFYPSLSDQQLAELQMLEAGELLRISGADPLEPGEQPDGPVYVRRDTLEAGQLVTIYLPASGLEETLYRVQFTDVGEGRGSYRRSSGNQNGAVFLWTGFGQGRYEPVIQIKPPESHQMVSLTSEYRFHEKVRTYSEWAVSQVQTNRFSTGTALSDQAIRHEWVAEDLDVGRGSLSAHLRYRGQTDGFRQFGRQNPIEYERYWNLGMERQSMAESGARRDELELEMQVELESETIVSAGGGYLQMAGAEALRAESEIRHMGPAWPEMDVRTEWVRQDDRQFGLFGDWFRQAGRIRKELGVGAATYENGRTRDSRGPDWLHSIWQRAGRLGLSPFFRWELEHRSIRSQEGLLSAESLAFDEIHPGLSMNGSWYDVEAGIAFRNQRLPIGNKLQTSSKARTSTLTMRIRPNSRFSSENSFQFRRRDLQNQTATESFEASMNTFEMNTDDEAAPKAESPNTTTPTTPTTSNTPNLNKNTILVRSFTRYTTLFGLETDLLYEVNTGQKSLYQERFIEVGPEVGFYVWEDLNEDGLQQLDEFFPEASPDEGMYVLQYMPSDELFTTADLHVRFTGEMDLLQSYQKLFGRDRTPSNRILWSGTLDINEVSTEQDLKSVYLLRPEVLLNDETTLNGSILHLQRIDWQNEKRTHEGSFQYRSLRSVNRRAGGLEMRFREQAEWEGGVRISSRWRTHWQWLRGRTESDSEEIATRNFQIVSTELQHGLEFIPNRSAKLDFVISWADNRNRIPGEALKATVWMLKLNTQVSLFQRLQNRAGIEIQHTDLSDEGNPHLVYEVSNGLGGGSRIRWNASSSYRTRGQLTFTLQVHGRTTMMNRIIQTAKFSVQANF